MAIDILITLLLVALNGFFVAAEFALVKVRRSQLDTLINQGNRTASFSRHILDHLDSYLSATQLGVTLASLGLGWIGEGVVAELVSNFFKSIGYPLLANAEHTIAAPVAFAIITVLHIVFGELAPKTLAIRYPIKTTLGLAVPLRIFHTVFRPFAWMLNGMANGLLKLFRIEPATHGDIHSEEELRLLLGQSAEQGSIESNKHELIENVFSFDDRRVRKIMVPRTKISGLNREMTLDEMADRIVEEGYSRMPVYDDNIDHIIGILYTKDLFRNLRRGTSAKLASMLRPPYFVPENKKISELLRDFQRNKTLLAVVVDEFGGTSGIVTLEDIIEELVGEIEDELDQPEQLIRHKEANVWTVSASMPISELNEALPEPIPESSDYDSLGGFLMAQSGTIPDDGQALLFGNYEFIATVTTDIAIEEVEVRYANPDGAKGD